ncbi:M24 family metallopeptidase [Lactobacillus delbrueckii]|uniref:M24 family metallopeptidase n=1 Tax=Lactobacillus delbrueckii TaxID=1584 RepID=UPI00237A2899|nr:M24 family metallopeptidase [Lactobacillus delbrueckii]
MSFPLIVQAGESAASISGLPSQKGVQAGDIVIFDLGIMKDGYASDVSRTVALGEISPAKWEIYETVRLAQETAARAARPGMTAGELEPGGPWGYRRSGLRAVLYPPLGSRDWDAGP